MEHELRVARRLPKGDSLWGALLARTSMVWWESKKVLPKGEDGGKKYNSSGAVGRAALAAALRNGGQRKQK